MPDTPYLVALVAVLTAAAFAAWVTRRSGVRSSEQRDAADRARSDLAGTRAELAAARAEVDQLTERLGRVHAELESARAPVVQADGRHVEVFVNLSRRLQSLVHREIKLLDALENEVEDPDLLKGLFQVDHLATRIRRHAENLAVLGGSVSRRQWSRPVALTEVLRSAIAEVEHYSRVKLVPPIDGTLPGHAVASVIHLIAELIENATMFAPPHTQVLLRAQRVTAGMAIEVEDRGLGMQRADQDRFNQLLVNPEVTNLDDLLRDGRIGLYVVSVIARQHGIVVNLQTNIYGGIQAVVILPQPLIGSPPEAAPAPPRPESLAQAQEQFQAQDRQSLPKRLPARDQPSPHPASARVSLAQVTPAHAAPAQPPPAIIAPTQATPAIGAPTHASPAIGTPTHASPAIGVPTHASPAIGTPTHASPAIGVPAHVSSGIPAQLSPAIGASAYAPPPIPTSGQPSSAIGASAYAPPTIPASGPAGADHQPTPSRPPLPRRRSQTHMAPQLQHGPPGPVTDAAGEQNPGLMASFMNGVSQAEAQAPGSESHG